MDKISQFTRYEIARIIGARALQIAMDAPLLLKMSKEQLEGLRYDPLKIAEIELNEGVLPISINRPIPRRGKDKLKTIKEEKISDEEIIAKEQEVEKEIKENINEFSLTEEEETVDETPAETTEEQ